MEAIVKRLIEHRIDEMTKKDAKGTLIDALQEEYPTCRVDWNSYHNCVDVIDERGQVIFQCYLDRDSHETTKYKYEKVDPSTLGPNDVVYKRVPAGKGTRYDYHADKSLLKSVSSTSHMSESIFTPDTNKGDKGFGSSKTFKAGDVCIYHFSGVDADVPNETREYYMNNDGAYCFVTNDRLIQGMVQIKFPSDLARGIDSINTAECYPEDLEKVSK